MPDNELFRFIVNGFAPNYGPYTTLYMARNVASQIYGGWWSGRNTNNCTKGRVIIQKLTPVLKPLEGGSLQLDLEWVDLP